MDGKPQLAAGCISMIIQDVTIFGRLPVLM
jgi:hypothetical protein